MYEYRARIVSIYDGDSIRADIDVGFGIWTANRPLRLAGIDAPELGTDEGRAARDWLREVLAVGQEVTIRTERDRTEKWGRYLAWITTEHDTVTVNQRMIDAGHARAYDGGRR